MSGGGQTRRDFLRWILLGPVLVLRFARAERTRTPSIWIGHC